jgi:hypothetical protein
VEDNPNSKGIAVNQDEIIEMARQAEILEKGDEWVFDMSNVFELTTNQKQLAVFAKLVALRYQKKIADLENIICQRHWDVLQEREACAKIADEWAVGWPHPSQSIAEWIRKRT